VAWNLVNTGQGKQLRTIGGAESLKEELAVPSAFEALLQEAAGKSGTRFAGMWECI
jgi:hypothetical protein